MIEQFPHVSLLNAGHMISACVPPVPFSRSTRKKLGILVRLGSPFHLQPSPGDVLDPRRAVFTITISCASGRAGFSAFFAGELTTDFAADAELPAWVIL